MRLVTLGAAVWTLLLGSALSGARAQDMGRCRMGPGGSSHVGCGLPLELANFQGYYECDNAVKVGRPRSLEELQALVSMFPRVKASGVGHSWWKEQFCAGNDSRSINIITTELKPTLDFMAAPADPKQWRGKAVPAGFPIQVDELGETVTVAAGITQRELLDYLAEYRYWREPSGWTLPGFSWFLDQTVGGAVATATHGSSMKWGSLSSQLRGLSLVLANGTLLELTPQAHPHLFSAAGVSVGRLGVLTSLKFKIVRQQAIQRKLQNLNFEAFARQLTATQEAYKEARASGDMDGVRRALHSVHETQAFWAVPTATVQRVDYEHLDHEPSDVLLNAMPGDDERLVKAMSGPEDSAFSQVGKKAIAANQRMTMNTRFWSNIYVTALRSKVAPGTFENRRSYLSMAEAETATTSTFAAYRQHEVAIPLERAGSCLQEVGREIYGRAALWEGARTPWLIRFVNGEPFYLSPASDGPIMYINLEDYISLSSGKPNAEFERVMELFRARCGARLHWGKEGWTRHARCFDGAAEYPAGWCSFGCAVQELDPTGKFRSEWDGWRWAASRDGALVPFAACCGREGFSPQCTCERRTDCKP